MKRFFAFIAAILLTGILQTRCYAGCNCDDWMEQGGYCVDYIKARIPAFPFPFTTTEIEALKNKNISDVTDGDVAVFELRNYWHVAYIEKVHRDEHGVASAIDVSEMNYGNHPSFAEFKMKWGQKNRSEWHRALCCGVTDTFDQTRLRKYVALSTVKQIWSPLLAVPESNREDHDDTVFTRVKETLNRFLQLTGREL